MNRVLLSLLIILVCVPAVAGEPVVFKMPKDDDVYFKSYFYTGSEYFQFSTNGTYRQVNREHMFVEESDHGTWSQAKSGELTLMSQEHYRNIECDPLSIFMWHTQAIQRLPWVKEQINELLANSDAQTFTKEQIEGIEKYGYKNCLSRISVDFPVKRVPREKLGKLAMHIDQFLNDPQKNHFHATPMTYKGQTFLLWRDAQTPINRDLKRIREELDEQKSKSTPAYIFTRITAETFQKESGKTQEFIFYPEMNKCVPQPESQDKETSNKAIDSDKE